MSDDIWKEKDSTEIQDMLEKMMSEEDSEKRSGLAAAVLKLDPGNPVAKYVQWQEMDDEESMEQVGILYEAIEALRPSVKNHEAVDEDLFSIFVSMLSDLSSFLYFRKEKDRAFEAAQELVDMDCDGYVPGRIVYYSILLERGEYRKLIDAADADLCETPFAQYCRAIALFELDGESEEASDAVIEAISTDPDLAFFAAGIWAFDDEDFEETGEDDEYADELMMQSLVLTELWAATEERLAFLSSIVFAFGYITGRVDSPEDIAMLEEGYRNVGCLDEMNEARDTVHAMTALGKDQEDVDEEALLLFKDMREKGIFS